MRFSPFWLKISIPDSMMADGVGCREKGGLGWLGKIVGEAHGVVDVGRNGPVHYILLL